MGEQDFWMAFDFKPVLSAIKNTLSGTFCWCAWRDLNPHGRPLDPKSSVSANSTTGAYEFWVFFCLLNICRAGTFW